MVIVVDASALLDYLLRTPRATAVEPNLLGSSSVHAPEPLDLEVLATLRRYERRGEIGARRAQEALEDLQDLPIALHPSRPLLQRAWTLRRNMTAADALYVALAEALGAGLLTTDGPLASAVRTHTTVAPIAP